MKTIRHFFSASLCGLAVIAAIACSTSKTLPLGPIMPESDDPEILARQYHESYEKWLAKNLRSYTMEFFYGARTPFAGIWEIDITDGRVTRRVFDGQTMGEETPIMRNMNMERLFEFASDATNAQRNSPFIIQASFYRDGGVASVRRVLNPAAPAPAPRDATWAYVVRELREIR
jgi:hypothetical protein